MSTASFENIPPQEVGGLRKDATANVRTGRVFSDSNEKQSLGPSPWHGVSPDDKQMYADEALHCVLALTGRAPENYRQFREMRLAATRSVTLRTSLSPLPIVGDHYDINSMEHMTENARSEHKLPPDVIAPCATKSRKEEVISYPNIILKSFQRANTILGKGKGGKPQITKDQGQWNTRQLYNYLPTTLT